MKLRLLPSAKKKREEQQKKMAETSKNETKKRSMPSDEYVPEIQTKYMPIGDNDSRLVFNVQRQGEFGLPYIDIRKFIKTPKYDGPTKSGINIPLEYLKDILNILQQIEKECREKGLQVDYNEAD